MTTESIMGFVVPAVVALLVLYLQERATSHRQLLADKASRERAVIVLESSLGELKSTTDKMSVVLDRVDSRLDIMSERITRVEAKTS
ncbi:MAG TPA: hypothetical protein VE944_19360 [Nostoc sp.]|uniref:hypothetical protein n=1 Tax=Nostoc sp. TaxID=1180 RepID=UPI002D48DD3E|nr:hypothetical protein [Nostoc sp.]HYX16481.1 hypothetical protein [Nostoc sp.]